MSKYVKLVSKNASAVEIEQHKKLKEQHKKMASSIIQAVFNGDTIDDEQREFVKDQVAKLEQLKRRHHFYDMIIMDDTLSDWINLNEGSLAGVRHDPVSTGLKVKQFIRAILDIDLSHTSDTEAKEMLMKFDLKRRNCIEE